MVQQDMILGTIRQNKDIILSLEDADYEAFIIVVDRLQNIRKKLDKLHEIRDALAAKLNERQDLSHLSTKLRFTINQASLFEDYKDFAEECLSTINPSTYLGLVCCAESTDKCHGIGYEFTNDYTKLKRKVGIMLGEEKKYWDKADAIIQESQTTASIAHDLLMRIGYSKELYSIQQM